MFVRFFLICTMWYLLGANTTFAFTRADTLRGADGRGRFWWDITHYDLAFVLDTSNKTIVGTNKLSFTVTATPCDSLQLDLQSPMEINGIALAETPNYGAITYSREGNVYWVKYPFSKWSVGSQHTLTISFSGAPREAVRPPWDGGFSYANDSLGHPWLSVSCQGLGASVWWPCKDVQWDEPDNGADIDFSFANAPAGTVRDGSRLSQIIVSNGRLLHNSNIDAEGKVIDPKLTAHWKWQVKNPINNYDITFYAGDYVHWHDTMLGEKGVLDLDFWVLSYHESIARKHFQVVKQMLHAFEYWMGPYPFYTDGYKMVESPYLGMEHQSAIAYGNNYKMGYKGTDWSRSGLGLAFDYIIVHESGHEWFGNNITAKDIADNWIQEGITTFSECLFAEAIMGKEKAMAYCKGERGHINNDKPLIGQYKLNDEGSGDIYGKGASIMYMIRVMTNDDEKFRKMLRGLTSTFYHKTVTTGEVEDFIAAQTGLALKPFFNQYLRTDHYPILEYYVRDEQLFFKLSNAENGLHLPIEVISKNTRQVLDVSTEWNHIRWKGGFNVTFADDFLFIQD